MEFTHDMAVEGIWIHRCEPDQTRKMPRRHLEGWFLLLFNKVADVIYGVKNMFIRATNASET